MTLNADQNIGIANVKLHFNWYVCYDSILVLLHNIREQIL